MFVATLIEIVGMTVTAWILSRSAVKPLPLGMWI